MSGFRADVLTLFPDMFPGSLGLSLAGDALNASLLKDRATNRVLVEKLGMKKQ